MLEGHTATAATMQVEVAIVAESLIVDATVGGQGVLVLAHPNLGLRHLDGLSDRLALRGLLRCYGLRS